MKSFHQLAAIAFLAFTAQSVIAAPPEMRETIIHELPERRVVIERAPGIILPDPPEPIVRPAPEPETAKRLAEMATAWRARRISHPMIHASATVYRLPDGKAVTHVITAPPSRSGRPPIFHFSPIPAASATH